MTNNNSLLKNLTSLSLVQTANYIFPFITIPIVSRVLGPDKVGLINYNAAFVLYFVLLISYSFELTGVRRGIKIAEDNEKLNVLFSTIFFSQVLLFIVSLLIFLVCLFFMFSLKQDPFVSIVSFFFCLQFLFTQNWIFQVKNELRFIAIFNFIARGFIMFAVVLFVKEKSDYIKYAVIFNIIPVLVSLISFFIILKKYNINIVKPKLKDIFNILKEDRIIFFSNVVIIIYFNSSTVILGLYHSNESVGYYTSAQKVVDIARNVIMRPFVQAFFPLIASLIVTNYQLGIIKIKKILPFFVILTIFIVILIGIFGPLIIQFFFGSKFNNSIILLEILNLGLFAIFINMFLGSIVMLNLNMDKIFLKISLFASIFCLIFNLIFVPKYGAIATASIWTITEFLIIICEIIVIKRNNIEIFSIKYFYPKSIFQNIKELRKNL